MPAYEATNKNVNLVRKYPSLLWDIVRMVFKHPVLAQACLIGFFTSTTFTSFWTTLTFLLAGSPYHYDSLKIGLFALIGIGSISWGPIFARTFMDRKLPILSVMIGQVIVLTGIIIGTLTGRHSAAGPAIQGLFIDVGLQTSQIGNRTAIYGVEPKARNRVNTAYMLAVFCGQILGTSVGNHLYAQGGWISSGSASIGFAAAALLMCFVRGPHEPGWIGWRGGWNMRKAAPPKAPIVTADEEKAEVSEELQPQPFADEGGDGEKAMDKEFTEKEVSQPDVPSESEQTLATNTPAGRRSLDVPQHIETEKGLRHAEIEDS